MGMTDYTELKEAAEEVRSEDKSYEGEGWSVHVGDGSDYGTLWRSWIDRGGLRHKALIAEFTNLADKADRDFIAAADPTTIPALIADLEAAEARADSWATRCVGYQMATQRLGEFIQKEKAR